MPRHIFAYMYYIIDRPALLEGIEEEVSHVADEAYADDGTALYDSVMVTSRDSLTLSRFVDDAVDHLVRREFDVCKYSPLVTYEQAMDESDPPLRLYYVVGQDGEPTSETTNTVTDYPVYTSTIASVTQRLLFHVPDFDDTMAEMDGDTITGGALKTELDRYIVLYACALIFQQRRAALVQEYTARAQSAMDKAVSILKYRKHPVTQW